MPISHTDTTINNLNINRFPSIQGLNDAYDMGLIGPNEINLVDVYTIPGGGGGGGTSYDTLSPSSHLSGTNYVVNGPGSDVNKFLKGNGIWEAIPYGICQDYSIPSSSYKNLVIPYTPQVDSYVKIYVKQLTNNYISALIVNGSLKYIRYNGNAADSSTSFNIPDGFYDVYYDGTNYWFDTARYATQSDLGYDIITSYYMQDNSLVIEVPTLKHSSIFALNLTTTYTNYLNDVTIVFGTNYLYKACKIVLYNPSYGQDDFDLGELIVNIPNDTLRQLKPESYNYNLRLSTDSALCIDVTPITIGLNDEFALMNIYNVNNY